MVAINQVPRVIDTISAERPKEQPTLTEAERQVLLLDKLDLSGLEAWPKEQAEEACSLLREYHNIFSLEKHDMGHTNATKHKIVLKDPDTPPFKECFRRILPPQLDEVREHLKLMLDARVVRPSNSPWCNAVVLVREKDGSLHFCIDFRRLNALTVKDSHPLPHICDTLEQPIIPLSISILGFGRFLWMRNLSSIPPLLWAVWVCMSVKVCLSGCVMPAYFPKAHAELLRRTEPHLLPHLFG